MTMGKYYPVLIGLAEDIALYDKIRFPINQKGKSEKIPLS